MKLPNDTQRTLIVGKTGSGKTQAANWHLSEKPFDKHPWIVFDFKYDGLINEIEGAQHVDLDWKPKKPGLYVVHPTPGQISEVEEFLWRIWSRENCGVYVDEGYMIDRRSPAFNAILTQGRSKHIPMILLSQRPVHISRFAISEAEFFQIFWLNDIRDRQTVQGYIPYNLENRLADYHSLWYDVGADEVAILKPVPGRDEILGRFQERLAPRKIYV